MANKLYPLGKEGFLAGDIDWDANAIKIRLLDNTYVYSAAHQFLSDTTGEVATSANLGSKTVTNGAADAADFTFSAVSGNQVTQFIIYADTGTPTTSRLIAHFDTATGLPVTPNGGDIDFTIDAAGLFSL